MDKKILTGIVESIVKGVIDRSGLTEGEARAMVGIALRKNTDAIVQAIAAPVLTLPGTAPVAVS